MRWASACGLAMAIMAGVGVAGAADLESGLQVGQSVGPFQVVKVAGADDDGIKVGAELCYR